MGKYRIIKKYIVTDNNGFWGYIIQRKFLFFWFTKTYNAGYPINARYPYVYETLKIAKNNIINLKNHEKEKKKPTIILNESDLNE